MGHPNQYVKAMKHFNKLFALWSPEQTTQIKPADCGYFDPQGDWHSVVDLRAIQAWDESPTAPSPIPEAKRKSLGRWQPVCSEGVRWTRSALQVPIKLPDFGVEFKFQLEFKKEKEYDACLVTGPSVTEPYLENPKSLFHEWVKQNYRSISEQYPDVRTHGLWIVTKAIETPRCAICSWDGCEESVGLYLGANTLVSGALTLGGAIGDKESSGIWRFLPAGNGNESDEAWRCVVNRPTGNIDDNYLIFIGGPRYYDGIFGLREADIAAPMRGEEELEDEFEIVRDGKTIIVACEDWASS
ncbi:hypothetical protein AOQ84DRAFT_355460 [Glonium stellatum]|uniref:Uncharacterized protein n=1 Tax=Glonium stellatum TaxID=574774 RepID=A0A8E2JR84_9PEZI|nr:hypothetical protein AOQ84DRAFT_355460 [Glonium stellatum]